MIAEKPLVFGRSDSLVGVWCAPVERRPDMPAVVFINAGIIHRVGPNRLHVNLARTLAAAGVPSLRFDLSGLGDSLAARDERGSILDWVKRDVDDALDLAASLHDGGIVVIGLCSGADNAFHAATRDARVVGAVLLDPNAQRTRGFYLRRYARAAAAWKTWRSVLTGAPIVRRIARLAGARANGNGASPFLAPTTLMPKEQMRAELDRLLGRGVRLLYIFTGGLSFRYNYGGQFADAFPNLVDGRALRVKYYGDWDHTFSDPEAQATLIALIDGWVREHWKARETLPAA